MSNVTVCDQCQSEFVINLKSLEHPANKIKGYVIESYFRCPHCNEKYIAFVTDKEARKMQKEIKKYHQSIVKYDYSNLTEEECKAVMDKHYEVLRGMKEKLKVRMDLLKTQVSDLPNNK